MLNLGVLSVTLRAGFEQFNRNADESKDKLKGVAGGMDDVVKHAAVMRVAAVGAITAVAVALIGATRAAIASGAELGRAAVKAGTAAGTFSELAYAGKTVGIDVSGMADAMQEMNKTLAEANEGAKKPVQTLRALGLQAKDFKNLKPEEAFELLAQRIRELPTPADKSRAAVELFGEAGARLLPLFERGALGIKMAREEAVRLGAAMSDETIKKMTEAERAVNRMKVAWESFALSMGSKIAPAVTAVLNSMDPASWSSDKIGKRLDALKNGSFSGMHKEEIAQMQAMYDTAKAREAQDRPHARLAPRGGPVGNEAIGFNAADADEKRTESLKKQAAELKKLGEEVGAYAEAMSADVHDQIQRDGEDALAADEELMSQRIALGELWDKAQQEASDNAARARSERIEELRQAVATEAELENEKFANQLSTLSEYNDAELEMVGGYQAAREALEKEHQDRLAAIRERSGTDLEKFNALSWDKQAGQVAGALERMTSGVASSSKKMFQLNKAAAIANAIVSTYAGVAKTLEAYPYPLSIGMAAAQAAAGFAQVNAIKNQQFGGGGGGGGMAGGGGSAAAPAPEAARQMIHIDGISEDSLFSGKSVRTLLDRIQEALDDGAKLVIN